MKSQHQTERTLIDATPEASEQPLSGRRALIFVLALILVALNLRPALSSLAPVLKFVQAGTGLSGAAAGLLTTLPVLCLGLFAPLAPRLAQRFGTERVVLWVLLILAFGVGLRGALGASGLFAGTVLAGASIGIIGVLLPGIVKREFPTRAALMTGVYTMALCLGAALAAGLTVPLQMHFGNDWRYALAAWAIPAVIAALCWWPYRNLALPSPGPRTSAKTPLWRQPLAWQVTLFMGLQSSLAYCVFGWLPSILQDRGASAAESGAYLSGSVMVQVLSALGAPWLSGFFRDQRPVIALMVMLTLAGLLGSLYAPTDTLWWWMVVLGLGQGGAFSMALSLIVLRTPTPGLAAQLSGMVQGFGYTLASLGPLFVGVIHEAAQSWQPVGLLFAGIASGALLLGLLAGRDRLLHDTASAA